MADLQLPLTPVPMFPLPGVFLFPHQVLPLHVFEPRYRDLVGDLLDATGRFVVATQLAGQPAEADRPSVLPVAGYGEIVRHEKLPDGRFLIWVVGLSRVRVREATDVATRYRQVVCEPFVEQQPGEHEAEGLAAELHAAAKVRIKGDLPLPESTAPDLLADLLVQTLRAPQDVLERVFVEPSVSTRARMVLDAATKFGGPDESDGDEPEAG